MFRYTVNKSGLPEEDLSLERLTQEAQSLLGAGSVSTARTPHFIVYYLRSNPHMRERLEQELSRGIGELATWSQLEKLPYLQALIKKGLR